jgi:3-deoxy-D-manno-octulosonate 8-phosphate phosphatase (KDO 8-P phosphatase)
MAATDPGAIELLVLDVDGVLTDGRIVLTPSGEEIKAFHAADGAGVKYWQRVGRKVAIISGRGSPAVEVRAAELGIEFVRLNAKRKLPAFNEALAAFGVTAAETAVVGDDLTDLPLLDRCGFAACPPDAAVEVRRAADLVTTRPGGGGCVREVVEHLLRGAGLWDRVLARYRPGATGTEDAP